MRVYALYFVILAICLYAYRDWFKSLCGLILLMAVVQHTDFPNSMGGMQGLNPWNLALLNVVAGWALARRREGLRWDMPAWFAHLLLIYLAVVLVGFFRALIDPRTFLYVTMGDFISERLLNTIKWVIPGLLLFDGCRDRIRLKWALFSTLAVYFLLAAQVIRWVPPEAATSGISLTKRSGKVLMNEVGYHPVNMSMLLAGGCWATLSALPIVKRPRNRILVVLAAMAIAYGQALTGGRMGYATWGLIGLTVGLLRWRRYLALIPVLLLGVTFLAPGAVDRMLQGFGSLTPTGERVVDTYKVTSGRMLIWPYVVDKIMESPMIGYGRLAMQRTGLADQLIRNLDESFPHPHNAYLELLLDNGVVGFLLIMPFYAAVVWHAVRLFRSRDGPAYVAVGGVCLSLVLALLIASMGSQSFYPREGSVGMWAAIGLMMRLAVTREQLRQAAPAAVPRARPAAMPAAPAMA